MVIFGCGYVGRELARAAANAGYEVWIHSRNPETLKAVSEIPLERHIVGDLHGDGWHRKLTGSWDVVFNLVSSAGGGLVGYELSYIEGNRSIMRWAASNPVKRFVYTSATSVYPQTDGEWVTEEDVPELEVLSDSGRILRRAEKEILESKVFGNQVVVRLGGIYGPGRHLYLNSLREKRTELPGDGSAFLNLIYSKDITDVLMHLAGKVDIAPSTIVNLVDDEPEQKQKIVDWLARQLGTSSLQFKPQSAGHRGARRAVVGGLPNRRVRNSRVKQLLDWEPSFPSFREGYADILKH